MRSIVEDDVRVDFIMDCRLRLRQQRCYACNLNTDISSSQQKPICRHIALALMGAAEDRLDSLPRPVTPAYSQLVILWNTDIRPKDPDDKVCFSER